MTFFLKQTTDGKAIEITQIGDLYYAKINHQPSDKYIIVCKIQFKNVDENTISDIKIYNPFGRIVYIINEFDYLDKDGNDTLTREEKISISTYLYSSQYDTISPCYWNNVGFCFGYC